MSKRLVLLLLLAIFLNVASSFPAKNEKNSLPVPPAELFNFLRHYGYLEPTPGNSEALYAEEAVIEAIKNMQKFGGLETTGELNNETLNLLIAPRCGKVDIVPRTENPMRRSRRFVVGGMGWRKRRVTYYIANWSPKIGTEEKIADDIRRAFDVWAHYSNIKFSRAKRHERADIIISFGTRYHGDNYPFDGPGNILAHAFYPYEDPSYGGDVHFDNEENWVEGAQTLREGVDFLSVAIHELGHSLGLAHSHDPSAVMFPYYRGGTSGHALQYDDILGMYELYVKHPVTEDENDLDVSPEIDKTTTTTTMRSSSRRRMKTTTTRTTTTEMPDASITSDDDKLMSRTTTDKPMATFEGDYETIEKHKERFTVTPSIVQDFTQITDEPTSVETYFEPLPDICLGNFDAAGVLRGEVFFFKDAYVWRLTQKLKLIDGYPTLWKEVFPGFPSHIRKIDALYERDTDSAIIFFTGNVFWVFDGEKFIENSPQSIRKYGISENFEKIDAVMRWAKNNKTYLFSGEHFWRYNDELQRLDAGYPMDMSRWYGIPGSLDAALTLQNGKTYFFKRNKYWLFNNKWVRPERTYPRRASKVWLGCK